MNSIKEEDVKTIQAEHPGILEIPENKNIESMPLKHFEDLANKKGRDKIVRALMNLYRWNKDQNPSLSKWAKDMQERLSARLDKQEESVKPIIQLRKKIKSIYENEDKKQNVKEEDEKQDKNYYQKQLRVFLEQNSNSQYPLGAKFFGDAGQTKNISIPKYMIEKLIELYGDFDSDKYYGEHKI